MGRGCSETVVEKGDGQGLQPGEYHRVECLLVV